MEIYDYREISYNEDVRIILILCVKMIQYQVKIKLI